MAPQHSPKRAGQRPRRPPAGHKIGVQGMDTDSCRCPAEARRYIKGTSKRKGAVWKAALRKRPEVDPSSPRPVGRESLLVMTTEARRRGACTTKPVLFG